MKLEVKTDGEGRLHRLLELAEKMPARSVNALVRALSIASQEIVGMAVKLRFTGQGPFPASQNKLGVRTGRLRRSIRATKPQANLRTGEITLSYGSNVAYFAIHEFGFNGAVQVKGHTRRLGGGQKFVRGKLSKRTAERMKKRLAGRHFGDTATQTKSREYRGVKWSETSRTLAGSTQVRPHKRRLKVPARKPLGTQLEHITSRAAYLRNIARQLEALLRGVK